MCNISSLYINRGIEKGRAEGKAEGSQETSIKMILEMFKNNIPVQTIANVAHLSLEETEKIINENS